MTEAMADPTDIYNWLRLDARTTTSGQPTQAQFDEIAALGVRDVINLAPATSEKALKNEAEILAALGMRYTHIPVDFQNPTEEDFDRFCEAFEGAERIRDACPLHRQLPGLGLRLSLSDQRRHGRSPRPRRPRQNMDA